MFKRTHTFRILAFLCLLFTLTSVLAILPSAADADRDFTYEESLAADLKSLGLFRGVSETNFDLKRAPTRMEALVMLIRILGREQAALDGTWTHPFTDVPAWADAYVGYAYENGLTKGMSASKFGSGDAGAGTYLTFVLRALGYSDVDGADFTWDNPYGLARRIGILNDRVRTDAFLRADAVTVSYAALSAHLKNSARSLAEKLIDAGAISDTTYEALYDAERALSEAKTASHGEKLTAEQIATVCAPAVFTVDVYAYNGAKAASGSGFFISADGLAVTNYHVVADGGCFTIKMADGATYTDISVIDVYKNQDLALLRVKGSERFPYLAAQTNEKLAQGQTVYAIGSPLGLDSTLSQGIVSNPGRNIDGTAYMQISVPIAHGSSGGALINEYGEAVGVTSAGYVNSTGDLNLAVSTRFLARLDREAAGGMHVWGDDYYPDFEQAYDFGSFSGLNLLNAEYTALGVTLRYDTLDCHPDASAVLPWKTEDEMVRFLVDAYGELLLDGGMHRTTAEEILKAPQTEDGEKTDQGSDDEEVVADETLYFASDIERVTIEIWKAEKVIQITVQQQPVFYKDYPGLIDFGWFSELSGEPKVKDDGSVEFRYAWTNDYYKDSIKASLYIYARGLAEIGYTPLSISQDGAGYLLDGQSDSVTLSLDERYVKLLLVPHPADSDAFAAAFEKLTTCLIRRGNRVTQPAEAYVLTTQSANEVYQITYMPSQETVTFSVLHYSKAASAASMTVLMLRSTGLTQIVSSYATSVDDSIGLAVHGTPSAFAKNGTPYVYWFSCKSAELSKYTRKVKSDLDDLLDKCGVMLGNNHAGVTMKQLGLETAE